MKKKILWITLLIIVIATVGGLLFVLNKNSKSNIQTNEPDNTYNKNSNVINDDTKKEAEAEYIKKELDDGTLYSLDGKIYESEIVVGDNYFDTTINDMYLNPDNYAGKNIEIEGLYFENLPYMFVGRYSTNSLCPYCPEGYSYLEYQLRGKLDLDLTDETEWIKVIGTLAKGNDETSYYQDYYYLEVLSIEVMNERGQTRVTN